MADVVKIPITKPFFGDEEVEAVARVLRSGWVTQGPEVEAFEGEFARYVGARHACAVSSCTAALHLALLAAGVRSGDEVVTVSHSFIATANAVRYCGATPVFVDIRPDTLNIDPGEIERATTERTKAILCVHQLGMPCDLASIVELGRRRSLIVIEDAACAAGSTIRWSDEWEAIGKPHGDIACFSFHPRKILTTGDGGMLTTANADFDAKFRLLRQHGMSVSDSARHRSSAIVFESYPVIGFNYRMTDLQAAVGRIQLGRLDEQVRRRRELAETYRSLLSGIAGITAPIEPEWARSNWQSFCVRLEDGIPQREFMQQLLDAGVSTRRGVMCAHRELAYRDAVWRCRPSARGRNSPTGKCSELAESEAAQDRCVMLPLYHALTLDDQRYVAKIIAATVRTLAAGG